MANSSKLLREGIIEYKPISGASPKDIPKFVDELDLALKESRLPENPEHENELREFLYVVRVSELEETIWCREISLVRSF